MTCALKSYSIQVSHSLIICLFEQYSNLRPGKITFDEATNNCDKTIAEDVLKCANSEESAIWEAEMGKLTPSHTFIPWILVDGKRDDEQADAIRENILKYFCDQRSSEKLPTCQGSTLRYLK